MNKRTRVAISIRSYDLDTFDSFLRGDSPRVSIEKNLLNYRFFILTKYYSQFVAYPILDI